MRKQIAVVTALLAYWMIPLAVRAQTAAAPQAQTPVVPIGSQRVTALQALNSQPLSFEENGGQGDSDVKFTSRGKSYTLFLTRDGAVLSLQESALGSGERELGKKESRASNSLLRMKFDNANPHADITGQDPLPGKNLLRRLENVGTSQGQCQIFGE